VPKAPRQHNPGNKKAEPERAFQGHQSTDTSTGMTAEKTISIKA
jgi:hypothetical protein